METKKKLRCPLGVPGGVMAAIVGLVGIIMNIIHYDGFNLAISFGLFIIAMPFIRFVLMVHAANDRLDELENKIGK